MTTQLPTPRCCIKHKRFDNQNGWRLMQITSSSSGNIAVSGRNVNTLQTFIDIFNLRNSGSEMSQTLLYSREFEEYSSEGTVYWYRYASVVNHDCDTIVTCIGDKLEIIQVSEDEVMRSRNLHGEARCMCVREREILIGFKKSNEIMVYDIQQLHEIRLITLQGIQDGIDGPFEMTISSDKLFVCVGRDNPESYHRSLVFQETNGNIVSELTYPSSLRFYAWSITADLKSGLVAVVWLEKYFLGGKTHIVLYSLRESSAFLIAEVESSLLRIRISDGADKMITGNHMTGEVNIYDMAELFTYSHLKDQIASHLKTDDFVKLTNFFCLAQNKTDNILRSDAPVQNFLFVLEEQCLILPSNVDRLTEAFLELKSSCSHLTEIYQRTRTSSYYKETIQKQRDEIRKLHDDKQQMKDKLETVIKGELLYRQRQLQLSTQADAEQFFQNSTKERYAIQCKQDQRQSQTCALTTTLRKISGCERHAETVKTNLLDTSCACASISVGDGYFPEFLIEGEFSKLLVKVSVKLTNTHCVLLANYFNFPASKIDSIRKDNETPGITLFGVMKERNVINMYDVTNLQQALVDLDLKEINETLVLPYQLRNDPSKQRQHIN